MKTLKPTWDTLVWDGHEPDLIWETFHENSKCAAYDEALPNYRVVEWMGQLKDSLLYDAFEPIPLTPRDALPEMELGLAQAILARHTPTGFGPGKLRFEQLSALLHYAYGINRTNEDTHFPRPFRNVPSGGGLFPLELYFHTRAGERTGIEGLETGLYHYSPAEHCVRHIASDDRTGDIAATLYQPEIPEMASLLLFQTALFRRSTFKYKDRGYRFTLIEAGHVGQNLNLVATAMGLGVWNVGGFQDRKIDRVLGLDGVNHSSLYLHAFGPRQD